MRCSDFCRRFLRKLSSSHCPCHSPFHCPCHCPSHCQFHYSFHCPCCLRAFVCRRRRRRRLSVTLHLGGVWRLILCSFMLVHLAGVNAPIVASIYGQMYLADTTDYYINFARSDRTGPRLPRCRLCCLCCPLINLMVQPNESPNPNPNPLANTLSISSWRRGSGTQKGVGGGVHCATGGRGGMGRA